MNECEITVVIILIRFFPTLPQSSLLEKEATRKDSKHVEITIRDSSVSVLGCPRAWSIEKGETRKRLNRHKLRE